MVGYLKHTQLLSALTLLLRLLSLSACVHFISRDEGSGEGGETVTESFAADTEGASEPDTDTGVETDSQGFPNLPEDDQTKRY